MSMANSLLQSIDCRIQAEQSLAVKWVLSEARIHLANGQLERCTHYLAVAILIAKQKRMQQPAWRTDSLLQLEIMSLQLQGKTRFHLPENFALGIEVDGDIRENMLDIAMRTRSAQLKALLFQANFWGLLCAEYYSAHKCMSAVHWQVFSILLRVLVKEDNHE